MPEAGCRDSVGRLADVDSHGYEIRLTGSLFATGNTSLLTGGSVPGRRFVIMDDGVPAWRRDQLSSHFAGHGVELRLLVLRGGEGCKEMDVVLQLVRELEDFKLDRRNEPVIIVGGGALLDLGGFAASIYRRGVPYIRVPTTVLAYVDAAVGIKTAVNFGGLKNLIGTFSEPRLVLLDHTLLAGLPAREISSGLGEILKLALGCDEQTFSALETADDLFAPGALSTVGVRSLLHRAIDVMLRELRANLREVDLARVVDLGHTFSQAFEMAAVAAALRHGEAVSLDLTISAVLAARRGLLPTADLARMARLIGRLGLPTAIPAIEPGTLWQSVEERTRHRGGRQRIPLPIRIGSCVFVDDIGQDEIDAAVAAVPALFDGPVLAQT